MLNSLNAAQSTAKQAIWESLLQNERRILVIGPTGMGKTAVYLSLLEEAHLMSPISSSLIMTPRRILVSQILDQEVAKFAPELSGQNGFGRFTIKSPTDAPIKVSTYYTGIRGIQNELINQKKQNFIILDEAHHSLSELRQSILKDPDATYIAFTATPSYYELKSLHNLGFKTVYKLSLPDAVKQGIIAPVRNVIIQSKSIEISLDEIPMDKNDYATISLDTKLIKQSFTQSLAHFYRTWRVPTTGEPIMGKIGIVSCNSIKHACFVAEQFNAVLGPHSKGSIPCEAIWGDMPEKKKKEIIERHKSGETLLLASADFLIEGYDNPRISLILNIRPTISAVIADQRAGRSLRIDREDPSKFSLVIDIAYNSRYRPQLFYSDVIGGILFESGIKFIGDSSRSRSEESYPSIQEGFLVHYDVKEVEEFKRANQIESMRARDPDMALMSDDNLNRMLKKGMRSISALHNAVQDFVISNGWREIHKHGFSEQHVTKLLSSKEPPPEEAWFNGMNDYEFSRKRVANIMTGRTIFYKEYSAEYNRLAMAIAHVLGCHPYAIFGKFPEHLKLKPETTEAAMPLPSFHIPHGIPADEDKEIDLMSALPLDENIPEVLTALRQFDRTNHPAKGHLDKEICNMLTEAFSRVMPKHEKILKQYYWDGETTCEIARKHNISRTAVSQRIANAEFALLGKLIGTRIDKRDHERVLKMIELKGHLFLALNSTKSDSWVIKNMPANIVQQFIDMAPEARKDLRKNAEARFGHIANRRRRFLSLGHEEL